MDRPPSAEQRITFEVVVSLRGPIVPGDYSVGEMKVVVSYPETIDIAGFGKVTLPIGLSTLFAVSWTDDGATIRQLTSSGPDIHQPVHRALDGINEVLLAYKLLRIGHIDGLSVRLIGEADC